MPFHDTPGHANATPEAGQRRVALVIGNAIYKHGKRLANPHNDAKAIAEMLARLEFELHQARSGPGISWHQDIGLLEMRRALADFAIKAEGADMAVVYFAGHGMEVDGENYLLPVDADLEHVRRVKAETVSLTEVLADLDRARQLPLVILDACRVNEFAQRMRGLEATRSYRSGLADIDPPGDVLVAYAARHGAPALDGREDGNSPYAAALLKHLETPDVDLRLLFGRVRDTVRAATNNRQVPHLYTSLGGSEIYLKRSARAQSTLVSEPGQASVLAIAAQEWAGLKGTTDIAALKRFAQHFAGYYGDLALHRIAELETELRRRAEVEAGARADAEARRREAVDREAAERAKTEQYRREGRIEVDAKIVNNQHGAWFKPGAGKTEWFKDLDIGPEMVVVPAGQFLMGSPPAELERESWQKGTESPQRRVTIAQEFTVGRHAITRGQFAAFVNDTGHKMEGGAVVWKGDKWEHDPKGSWRAPGFPQDDSHPIVCVSWDDARAYAAWLSAQTGKVYRLLTEAEWEYIARAGTTTPFWWGPSITPSEANYNGDHVYAGGGAKGEWRKATVPVASFAANPWGLYNVHGNVWEWCEDVWHDTYDGAPADGSAWAEGGDTNSRVLRGGSWLTYPRFLRSALRNRHATVIRGNFVGFRLGRTLFTP